MRILSAVCDKASSLEAKESLSSFSEFKPTGRISLFSLGTNNPMLHCFPNSLISSSGTGIRDFKVSLSGCHST
ncbi:hypothetical protein Leryth_019072 [Lithospermum erythrorhizon]|nr:hypothetical protein Leryth_019072 [Lithospermum erythrorhizon]